MKKFLAMVLALLMVLSLVSCGSSGSSSGDAASADTNATEDAATEDAATDNTATSAETEAAETTEDGEVVLRVGTSDNMGSFLIGGGQGSNYRALYLVFDSIFYFDENNEPYSTVLSDWYYEDDLTFVMTVKDGIYFSNGDQMTGEDILFSLSSNMDEARGSNWTALFQAFDFENSYVSDDGMTVYLKTYEPYGPGVFGCGNVPVLDKAWAEEVGYDSELWINDPVGSGPYKCVQYETDNICVCEKRDDYWDTTYENEIDRYEIRYFADDGVMYIALENGEIDIACNISNSDYSRGAAGESANVEAKSLACGDVIFLSLDVDANEYLQNEKVREAICYGVDWEQVAQASRGEMAVVATSIISDKSSYHVDCGAYTYDPERAQAALDESGYSGEEISLYLCNLNEEVKDEMATMVQYYLSQLGITMTFEDYDFLTCLSSWLEEGGTDLSFQDSDTGSIIGEPFVSLRFLMSEYGPFPVCTIGDETFNELAEAAINTVDTAERAAAYEELQQYAYEHYLVVPIFYACDAIAWRTDVVAETGIQNPTDVNLRNVQLVH